VAEALTVAATLTTIAANAAPVAARATKVKIHTMQMPSFYSLQKILVPSGALGMLVLAYRHYAWPGVAGAVGALVMWMLLHFTRMLQVMQRAARRPKGYVDSAVMLNAKLRLGMPLLHVVAMTRALGQPVDDESTGSEVFCWTDGSLSTVRCDFRGGRLKNWSLQRPTPVAADAAP